jgi:hypothetical protein
MNASTRSCCLAAAALSAMGGACAQAARQEVKPPQAQAWIDVATLSGMGMPMGGGGANPMAAIGSLFGGSAGAGRSQVSFLMTQGASSGRYVDVTLSSRLQASLTEAAQEVPSGFLSTALKLVAPSDAPPARGDDDVVPPHEPQQPKGKIYVYWGCGENVRPGQPRVVDLATATASDLAQVFQARRATQRGAHSAAGRPHWPNRADSRAVPDGASLVGTHQFTGAGLPQGFRFTIPAAQDLMPPMQLQQAQQGGAVALSWATQPHARGFFVAGMGARGNGELVFWSSSELPDIGAGLTDYQTNAAVDGWLREKVLLSPQTTRCTVPNGVFPGEGAMLRAIAYGNELNLAHPQRPTDPKIAWEPVWAVKVRVKSMAFAVLGMPSMDESMRAAQSPEASPNEQPGEAKTKPSAFDIIKGVLGR